MKRSTRGGAAWLALAFSVTALAACGSSNNKPTVILNTEKVERAIEQSILSKRHLKSQVSCPSGVHQQKGLVFKCTAMLKRGATTFDVTEVDGNGNVTYIGR